MKESKIFDIEGAMARLDNDKNLYRELVAIFEGEYPSSMEKMSAAIRAQDKKELETSAHSIKGALGNIGAMVSYDLAYELEIKGRTGDFGDTGKIFMRLEESVAQFLEAFRGFN